MCYYTSKFHQTNPKNKDTVTVVNYCRVNLYLSLVKSYKMMQRFLLACQPIKDLLPVDVALHRCNIHADKVIKSIKDLPLLNQINKMHMF